MLSGEKLSFQIPEKYAGKVFILTLAKKKHGIMQEKTSDYMPRVNTKLVNCNLQVAILSLEKHINIMETIKT